MRSRPNRKERVGFTVWEVVAALGILVIALTLVAEVSVFSLRERARDAARQKAQEAAANVLESARALPWESLTPEWASAQRLPDSFDKDRWRLTVRVGPEASRPQVKRVTVEVRPPEDGTPERPVDLVGLFAARSTQAGGEKP